jgi:polyhydroxyalkanoate synthesis regulator phasin
MTRTATKRRTGGRSAARSTRTTAAARRGAVDAPSLRELWLAGLGAAAVTGEAANDLVEALVAKGREAEPRVKASAERAATVLRRETRRVANQVAEDLGARAKRTVQGALERLGVAPRKSKNVLHRLGDLAEAIL